MVGLTASETKDPHKVIPEAINDSDGILLFYIGALFVIMCIYPWRDVSPVNSPLSEVFRNVGIPAAADIINFVVLTAAASACNSSIFSTGRLPFSLTLTGKSKSARWTAKLSRRQVPARAIMISTEPLLWLSF